MDNKKSVLLAVLIVGVVSMTIAFAALSTRLNIEGTAQVADTNWNIHFDNWQVDTASTVTYSGITHQNTAEYPSIATLENSMSLKPNVTKVENVNITLKQPGDYAKYNFEIVNSGTIDASLDSFTPLMTCESGKNCDFLTYEVKCYDNQNRIGNEVTVSTNNTLSKNGGKVYCYLSVTYNDQTNTGNAIYTQEAVSATLSANWTWVQKKDNSQSGNSGTEDIQVPAGSYLVTYNANGGTGSMNGQVIDPTVSNTLTTNTYTKSGYTFAGWNTESDGSGTSYTNGQVLAANTVSSNMALYAEWMREGWDFENRESITNPRNQVNEQNWTYYKNGTKVVNELLLVPGSYEDVTVPIHHYLIKDGYMHIGWYEENGEYYYFSTTPGKYGWVQGFRYESITQTIDGVTYTFDSEGRATPKPVPQSNYVAYKWNDVSSDGYNEAGSFHDSYGWYTSLNPESRAYIRTDGTTPEACGVFDGGQVCFTAGDYSSDFSSCSGYTSYDGTGSTCITGYAKAKADEMLSKGASSCRINGYYVSCDGSNDLYCDVYYGGNIICGVGENYYVNVYPDGSAY